MNEYMNKAIELANDNLITNVGGPFGAVIVKEGKIIGVGSNHVLGNNDPTAHAEVMAIRDACKNINSYDLKDCIIYTSSYPCPMCLSAILWANIKEVYYANTKEDTANIGFRDDFIYKFIDKLNNNIEDDSLKLYKIDSEEAKETYKKYKEKLDKIIY